MDRLKEFARFALMMTVAVPLSVIAFVVVAWHLLTNEDAAYPYSPGAEDDDADSD